MLPQQGPDPLVDARETSLLEHRAEVVEEDGRADRGRLEEREPLAVAEELLERLGDGGEVDPWSLGRGVVEQILLGQRRLAAAGLPHDHGDAVGQQASAEDPIEAGIAARDAVLVHGAVPRYALSPSRSRTV